MAAIKLTSSESRLFNMVKGRGVYSRPEPTKTITSLIKKGFIKRFEFSNYCLTDLGRSI